MIIAAIIIGVLLIAVGAFIAFAGGMSDAPVEGAKIARRGGMISLVGLALIVGGIKGL
jgi:hypothetical protein